MIRLRELREERHKSQQWLAIKLNVSQTMISKYELGQAEPDITMLIRMTELFGVSLDYLLGVSDNKLNVTVDGLSTVERQVLFDFKRLDEMQKAKLQAYLQGLLQE